MEHCYGRSSLPGEIVISTIIVITPPPTKPQKSDELGEATNYTLHTIGGDLTDKQKREILRGLLKDLRDD